MTVDENAFPYRRSFLLRPILLRRGLFFIPCH
nr:MAG TPA: hypothetical protein [Caudoviricetes sp.]